MIEGPDNTEDIDVHEAGNYFISLTDLMTGVVFIFVILLVITARTFYSAQDRLNDEQKIAQETKSRAAKAENGRVEAENRAVKAEKKAETLDRAFKDNRVKVEQIDALAKVLKQREEERGRILENLSGRLNTRGVAVSLDPKSGIIRLPEELLFDSGQAALRPQGVQALEILAAELTGVLQHWCSSGEDFRLEALFIEGHTDNVPIKNARFADNWELSTARAVNVARGLKQSQPEIATFKNPANLPVLGVSGYGENRPVADNSTDDGRRKNRRIDLRFLLAYPNDEQLSRATGALLPADDAASPLPTKPQNSNR